MHGNFRSRIVDPGVFDKGDTFSFRAQPYLKELFDTVRGRGRPLTVVVGAGVSMNSSLPSWRSLIDKMTQTIADGEIRKIAFSDDSDLMRKAEIVLQLVKDGNRNIQDHEIIRDALYQRDLQVTPGELAKSMARLVYATRADTRLLTTNFDIILEEALLAYFAEAPRPGERGSKGQPRLCGEDTC
jgi:NAD-dependent SIR2 family protein deacetylase